MVCARQNRLPLEGKLSRKLLAVYETEGLLLRLVAVLFYNPSEFYFVKPTSPFRGGKNTSWWNPSVSAAPTYKNSSNLWSRELHLGSSTQNKTARWTFSFGQLLHNILSSLSHKGRSLRCFFRKFSLPRASVMAHS